MSASLISCVASLPDIADLRRSSTSVRLGRAIGLLRRRNACAAVVDCSERAELRLEKAYAILDELIMGGEMTETSKKAVLRAVRRRASVSR